MGRFMADRVKKNTDTFPFTVRSLGRGRYLVELNGKPCLQLSEPFTEQETRATLDLLRLGYTARLKQERATLQESRDGLRRQEQATGSSQEQVP